MNGLEGSKVPSPEVPGESKVGTSKIPEKKGKLKGSPVSKQPDTETVEKADSVAKNKKLAEARELVKQEMAAPLEKSQRFKALSEQFEGSQLVTAKPQQKEVKELEKSVLEKFEGPQPVIAKPQKKVKELEKSVFEQFEGSQPVIAKPQKEVREDEEALLKLSVADKKLDLLYQSAKSTNDTKTLDSIKKEIEQEQKDIQSLSKFSIKKYQDLPAKCKRILEEIDEMGKVLKNLEIMKKGESMQGYPGEVLSYEGYQLCERIKEKDGKDQKLSLAEETLLQASEIHRTSKAIKSVKKKLEEARIGLIKGLSSEELKQMATAIKAGKATEEQVKLAVDCKRLWMELATEEGSYLELLNFIGKKDFEGLEIIKEVAFMQGPQVDMMLNKVILEDHAKNKPSKGPPLRVLVEGAGPNGLYASLQFFRSGASVSVVNDRGEKVVRNQNMIMDPKLIAQLNFLLGSKFDELFVDPKALGVLNLQRGSGTIKTRVLEDVMKARVAEISSYIEDTRSFGKETFLNLHYEAPLTGIKPSEGGFSAIIGTAKASPDAAKFQKIAIESLTKKILSTKYAKHQPEDIIDDTTVLKKAQEEAKGQWEKEQSEAKREQVAITFDFLACIGGANDSIRDEFLEPAVPLTLPKNYGIASWLKPETQANQKYFSQDKLSLLNVQSDKLGYPYLTRQHVEKSLRKQELDQLLTSSGLPEQLIKKYENFTENLLKNIETTHLPDVGADQPICGFNIRTFENYATVFLSAATPPLLSDFLHDLDKLIAKSSPPEDQQLKDFKKEIDKKWMNALADVFGIDPLILKLDDEYSINVGTFDVQQKGIDTAAKLLESGESSALIASFADSRTSPHFYSGSGMSTGRLSVEDGTKVLRAFNREEIRSKEEFAKKLNKALGQAKEKAIDKGRRFVKQNTPSERIAAKCLILKKKIKEHFDHQQKTQSDIAKTGWKIKTEVNEQGEFGLIFINKDGKQESLNVKISEEDGQLHANGKKYLVFNDLLLDLGVV